MNWMHLHLMVNHLPIFITPFAGVLFVVAFRTRSRDLRTAAFVLLVCAAAAAGLAYFTGEQAEDSARGVAGIATPLVLRHDDAAWYGLMGTLGLGALALWALFKLRGVLPLPNWFVVTMVGLGIVTVLVMTYAANLGGQIRHPEIGRTLVTNAPDRDR